MAKEKKIKQRHPSNLKINTRIIISSVLAVVIPILIICIYATYFTSSVFPYFSTSRLTTNSYSTSNQIEWYQALSKFSKILLKDDTDEEKMKNLDKLISPLEEIGANIYISTDNNIFYSTDGKGNEVINIAKDITDVDIDGNLYYFGDDGLVIVNHAISSDSGYVILIAINDYHVPNISQKNQTDNPSSTTITTTTVIFFAVIAILFAVSILIISLLVSKTIINPIKMITKGANEIANGNYDYRIDYESTNELGQLAKSFNIMRLKVKESIEKQTETDLRQRQTIAGLAHDLRTPLTSIKGYVEGLRDGIADTPEMKEQYLDTIYSSTCDTQKMLEDLLMISNFEIGAITLNKETVTIDDIVNYAYEVGHELTQCDFELEVFNYTKSNPTLSLDTDRFVRVIDNIISNSVKYRRKDVQGKITFTLSEYAHTVIFEIKDNGMGVDTESLPHIFEMSFRADKARSNVHEGSGLGLAVCKEIVELHGGMIWAQSEAGQGLSIFISLPINE